MSVDLAALIGALLDRQRDLGDWAARARAVERVEVSGAAGEIVRVVRRVELAARVHVDGPTGRGSADLVVASETPEAPLRALIGEAIARAEVSIGPAWQSSPPGAPARVLVADGAEPVTPEGAAALRERITSAAAKIGATLVSLDVLMERATVQVVTSRGLDAHWDETLLGYDARVASGSATARASETARRRRSMRPRMMMTAALDRARARSGAVETPIGRRAVLVPAAVLAGDGAAMLAALAELADAALARQGLARARIGDPIVDGADTAAEPLSLASDGTLRWATASAPLGDHGEPVRRFPIVTDGILVGLALDEREGALRGTPPNAGVRNLVVGKGASTAETLRTAGVLELLEVSHVDVEALTGRVALGIGLATLHDDAGARTVVGRELQGDLVAAFARSRRTAGRIQAGAYDGPELILLPDLEVV